MHGGWSDWQGWEKCTESYPIGASKTKKKHFIFFIFEWINQFTVVGVIGRVGKNALNHTL